MSFSRRLFLQQAALATAAISIPTIISAAIPPKKGKKVKAIKNNGVIVFQGDSITDAGREKTKELPNNGSSFGTGYAFIAAAGILNHFAPQQPVIYNRGISGNKVYQLAERWQKDCIDLKPDFLSILIGVNDYWHMRDGKYSGTVEIYTNDFRQLLQKTKTALPQLQLVICQPFALPGTSAVDETWVQPLKGYQEAAENICKEFGAIWVPFQQVFDEAIKHAPAKYWSADGVHPSMAGSQLMAAAWLKTVFGISTH